MAKFTGEQEDGTAGDTSYYFLRARYLDVNTGRFVSRDPVEFEQRYGYVLNNPVLLTDPSGEDWRRVYRAVVGYVDDCLNLRSAVCERKSREVLATSGETASRATEAIGYAETSAGACLFTCFSVGYQASLADGVHFMLGTGGGAPQIGVTTMWAPGQRVTRGWQCGGQVSVGGLPSGTVQVGAAQGNYEGAHQDFADRGFLQLGLSFGLSVPLASSMMCNHIW